MMLVLLIFASWVPAQAAAGPAVLVKAGFSSIEPLVSARGTLFFVASDQEAFGLWTSDGTSAGTRLLRQAGVKETIKMSGKLYFTSYESSSGWELWRSDGTVAGTTLLKDINPGPGSGFPYQTNEWASAPFLGTVVSGYLYFVANDGAHGLELWRTDGTTAGTVLVRDLTEGSVGSSLHWLTSAKGQLFFTRIQENTVTLWRSDGSGAGTIPLTPIELACFGVYGSKLIEVGQTVFFSNSAPTQGCGLWASDGTPAGTRLLKAISYIEDLISNQMQTAVMNGSLFFAAGNALWRSDGTPAGTVAIKSLSSGVGNVVNANGTLFFLGYDAGGASLWRSDGTLAGTRQVSRLLTWISGDPRSCFNGFTSHNGMVFFNGVAEGSESGCELWRSDGTQAGTVMVKDLVPGPAGAYPRTLTDVNGLLVFVTNDVNLLPTGLAKSDGTPNGTALIGDFKPTDFAIVRSLMFVSTYNPNTGRKELWAVPLSALGIRFAYLPSIHQ